MQLLLQQLNLCLLCDNLSASFLSNNPVTSTRTKHIRLDFHFVREKVEAGELLVHHIPAADQQADILTKPLTRHQFSTFKSKLLVFPRPLACGGVLDKISDGVK